MNNDIQEDVNDAQDILKQKTEHTKNDEEMGAWEFGKGIKPAKDNKKNV